MTVSNRIVLNTVATYARSLLSLLLGLFSVRWVLAALGQSDYGLFGVVGGIVVCVQLLNVVMGNAVSRFYAFAIGETEKGLAEQETHELLSAWFNSAVSIHFILPTVLIAVGYPIGIWAIENWLVIPQERIYACIWVFRLALLAAFFNMASVPYIAMYRARQLIVELTVWDVLRSIITFVGAFALMYIKSDRLIAYAVIMAVAPLTVLAIQVFRARQRFPYCHIRPQYLFNKNKITQIGVFGICDLFSSLGVIARDNGAAFIINKIFGPIVNSAYGVANQLSMQTNTLANAMHGALMPAVATSEGAGRHNEAITLSHRSCKFYALLVLLFAVPLYIEAAEVLRLWLVTPPEHTVSLCRCVLVSLVCAKLGLGYHMTILARGKVGFYQFTLGCVSYLTVIVMYFFAKWFGVIGIGYAIIANAVLQSCTRVVFAHFIVGVGIRYWARKVVCPITVITLLTAVIGNTPSMFIGSSFLRICITTVISVTSLAILSLFLAIDKDEYSYLSRVMASLKGRLVSR